MNLKLGRTRPTSAKLKLANYLGPKLPPPPLAIDWSLAMSAPWGAMKNDVLGICTCSGMGHAVQVITSNGDGLITPSDDEIVQAYEVVSGYDPSQVQADGSNPTDQGATELAAMRFMVDKGLAGVRCDAFADVNHKDIVQVKQSIALMGGCYIGVELDQSDIDDFEALRQWTSLKTDRPVGGHALWVTGYNLQGIEIITWGVYQLISWDWFKLKCDEAHAMIFFPWATKNMDTSPAGFSLAQLETDLKSL